MKKHKGTRMVKDGEDWHGLQTTKLKNLSKTFQTVQPRLCSFKPKPIIVTHSHRCLFWSFDWFTVLSTAFVIGQSYYLGFGFTALSWKLLFSILSTLCTQWCDLWMFVFIAVHPVCCKRLPKTMWFRFWISLPMVPSLESQLGPWCLQLVFQKLEFWLPTWTQLRQLSPCKCM